MTFEAVMPTTMSTSSLSTSSLATCRPTSGLLWASTRTTSTFWPPSIPSPSATRSMKPSYWSAPNAASTPLMAPMCPIFNWALAAVAAISAMAPTARLKFVLLSSFISVSLFYEWPSGRAPGFPGVFAGQYFGNLLLHCRLVDLANPCHGELLDNFDSFGALELRQALRYQEIGQLAHARRGLAWLGNDEYAALFAIDRIWHGNELG